ncbi:MAG: hypothetical protein M3Q83_05180 [Pseudomonadota bacterium]|nr:hypothetical protein [Pseudomonadota bacterium]
MSEQSFAQLRRRPGSTSFVAACEAAIVIATRRLRSVAFDRAINGYTRQIFYHGELKGEERVFDPRLLILLLQKSGLLFDPVGRGAKLEANWSRTIEAVGDGIAETDATGKARIWCGRRAVGWGPASRPPRDFAAPSMATSATRHIAAR